MNKPLSNLQVRDLEAVPTPMPLYISYAKLGQLSSPAVKGCFIRDTQGKEYIEGMAGLWCTGLGFGNEEMIEASDKQIALPLPITISLVRVEQNRPLNWRKSSKSYPPSPFQKCFLHPADQKPMTHR